MEGCSTSSAERWARTLAGTAVPVSRRLLATAVPLVMAAVLAPAIVPGVPVGAAVAIDGVARFQNDPVFDDTGDPAMDDGFTGDQYDDPYDVDDPYYVDDPYMGDDPYYVDDPYMGDECWDEITGMPCGLDPETGFSYEIDPITGDTIPFDDAPFDDAPFDDAPPEVLALERPLALARATAGRAEAVDGDEIDLADLDDGDVAGVAAGRLALAIDSLAELGAFARDEDPAINEILREIRTQIPADGLSADGYRAELERFAVDFPDMVGRLQSQGIAVSDELMIVAAVLDEGTLSALDAGDTGFLPAIEWLDALADLAARGGTAGNGPADDVAGEQAVLSLIAAFAAPPPAPAPVADGLAATTSTTVEVSPAVVAQDAATDDTTDSVPLGLIGGIAAALFAAIGAVVAVGRRRRTIETDPSSGVAVTSRDQPASSPPAVQPSTDQQVSLVDLLEASRRMTASLDRSTIAGIAVEEAMKLVDAEGGLVVARDDDLDRTLQPLHHQPAAPFNLANMGTSNLQRVVETGRSTSTVATDEPILIEVPMAVASVAIVADGVVVGALMVIRVATRPFDSTEVEALGTLSSLVGSALAAAATHDSANELADVEPMTGLKNRRRLDRDLSSLGPSDRVAYVMVDVDHFKNFNDVNGHAAGDEALKVVASTLEANVRPTDVVYRYGGEEFCVLLPGATSAEAADIAERARAAVETSGVAGAENQPGGCLTISVGVADTTVGALDDLIERADAALYRAKDGGRNRVQIEGPSSPTPN